MVKQHEQSTSPDARVKLVGWKKFCVVFSKAWTEKFSQYAMTLLRSALHSQKSQKRREIGGTYEGFEKSW